VSLAQLVTVTGSRWKVEDGFAGGKELAALDEHQVRSWTSWHRWTILALLAHAFLSVLASQAAAHPGDDPLIPLTRHEIRRLLTGLTRQLAAPAAQLHWSRWRRRHQATARNCHPPAAGRANPGSTRLSLPSLRWPAETAALSHCDGPDRRVVPSRRFRTAPGAAGGRPERPGRPRSGHFG